jgi:hypothetical protein
MSNQNDKINSALEYAELLDIFQNLFGRSFSNKSAPRSITIDDSNIDLALYVIKYCPQSAGGERVSRMLCLRLGFLGYEQPF